MPIRKYDFIFHAGYYVPIERIAFVMQPGGTAERHIRVLRPSNGIEGRVFYLQIPLQNGRKNFYETDALLRGYS